MTSDDGGDQRVGEAILALMELIDDELILVKPEAIARLSEKYHRGDDRNFDSHIVGRALLQLQLEGSSTSRPLAAAAATP